jgi:hypothetical protein
MGNIYKTAMGRPIDMDALRAKNELVRAVSNVPMNARGDIIDSDNNIVTPVSERVNRVTREYSKATPKSLEKKLEKKEEVVKPAQPAQHTTVRRSDTRPVVSKTEPPVIFAEDLSPEEMEIFDEFDDVDEVGRPEQETQQQKVKKGK